MGTIFKAFEFFLNLIAWVLLYGMVVPFDVLQSDLVGQTRAETASLYSSAGLVFTRPYVCWAPVRSPVFGGDVPNND